MIYLGFSSQNCYVSLLSYWSCILCSCKAGAMISLYLQVLLPQKAPKLCIHKTWALWERSLPQKSLRDPFQPSLMKLQKVSPYSPLLPHPWEIGSGSIFWFPGASPLSNLFAQNTTLAHDVLIEFLRNVASQSCAYCKTKAATLISSFGFCWSILESNFAKTHEQSMSVEVEGLTTELNADSSYYSLLLWIDLKINLKFMSELRVLHPILWPVIRSFSKEWSSCLSSNCQITDYHGCMACLNGNIGLLKLPSRSSWILLKRRIFAGSQARQDSTQPPASSSSQIENESKSHTERPSSNTASISIPQKKGAESSKDDKSKATQKEVKQKGPDDKKKANQEERKKEAQGGEEKKKPTKAERRALQERQRAEKAAAKVQFPHSHQVYSHRHQHRIYVHIKAWDTGGHEQTNYRISL